MTASSKQEINVIGQTSQDVTPILKSYEKITTKQQIAELIEEPLVQAMQKFFDKKIESMDTSANNGKIRIQLFYDSLSPQNREIAKKLGGSISISGRSGGRPIVRLSLPPIASTPVTYIQDRSNWIADQFIPQKIKITKKTWTLGEMAEIKGIPGASEKDILEEINTLIQCKMLKYNPTKKIIERGR